MREGVEGDEGGEKTRRSCEGHTQAMAGSVDFIPRVLGSYWGE